MAAGAGFNLKPGHTSSIRRIEGGMLSYHADADIHTNPFELGLDRLLNLDSDNQLVGKAAIQKIRAEGVSRKQVGLKLSGERLDGSNTRFWSIQINGDTVDKVTSAVNSPRLEYNIALAMIMVEHPGFGRQVDVLTTSGTRQAVVVEVSFYDPRKQLATGA